MILPRVSPVWLQNFSLIQFLPFRWLQLLLVPSCFTIRCISIHKLFSKIFSAPFIIIIIIIIIISLSRVTSSPPPTPRYFSPWTNSDPHRSDSNFRVQNYSYCVFKLGLYRLCSESTECFSCVISKFFFKLYIAIPVAAIMTDIIVHNMIHIRCIATQKLSHFSFPSAFLFVIFYQCGCFFFFVFSDYIYNWPTCYNFSICVYFLICYLKCTLVQALRLCTGRTAHWESSGITLLFLDHGTRRGQRHASAALYPRERPGTHCTGGWVGPRSSLDRCGKSRCYRDSIPGQSSP